MQRLLNFLRRCALCESLFGGELGLCSECGREWSARTLHDTLVPGGFPFEVHRLFISSDREDEARKLVVLLKGDHRRRLWRHFARLFFVRRVQRKLPSQRVVLVSAPSSTERSHAQIFAEELSVITDWPHCELFFDLSVEQKGKTREQRIERQLSLKAELPFGDVKVVFVDDLLATGGTAIAAWEALGRPPLETWVLTHQLLLH